jgi:hypothetical protein
VQEQPDSALPSSKETMLRKQRGDSVYQSSDNHDHEYQIKNCPVSYGGKQTREREQQKRKRNYYAYE